MEPTMSKEMAQQGGQRQELLQLLGTGGEHMSAERLEQLLQEVAPQVRERGRFFYFFERERRKGWGGEI